MVRRTPASCDPHFYSSKIYSSLFSFRVLCIPTHQPVQPNVPLNAANSRKKGGKVTYVGLHVRDDVAHLLEMTHEVPLSVQELAEHLQRAHAGLYLRSQAIRGEYSTGGGTGRDTGMIAAVERLANQEGGNLGWNDVKIT